MRLPSHTAQRLKLLARRYGSQANAVVELVDAKFACPICGNRDMDTLVWNEDTDLVTCAKCGATYNPLEG
jgi:transcription elongation factor Elf1